MKYRLYHSDGRYIVINDAIDTSTSIPLGGDFYDASLVSLLENFSSPYKPSKPINGQVWFDSKNKQINTYYNGWNVIPTNTKVSIPQIDSYSGSISLDSDRDTPMYAATRNYMMTQEFQFKSFRNGSTSYVVFSNNYTIINLTINPTSNIATVTLPFRMADIRYSVLLTVNSKNESTKVRHLTSYEKTLYNFKISIDTIDSISCIIMGFKDT